MSSKAALLDYYSDTGSSHITIFVACLFGLFTILGLIRVVEGDSKDILIMVYLVLLAGGAFSLLKYSYYYSISSAIAQDLGEGERVRNVEDKELAYWAWPYHNPRLWWIERIIYQNMNRFRGSKLKMPALFFYLLIGLASLYAVLI